MLATSKVSGPGQAAAPAASCGLARVEHEEPQLGGLGARQRAAQPFLLDRVGAVAQPGGIGQHDRVAGEVDRHLDHVAGRAGDRRGDRRFAPRQPVQQARFAGIRRADDRDRDAVAQPLAAAVDRRDARRSRRRGRWFRPRPRPRSPAADPRRENRSPLRDAPAAAAAASPSRDRAPPSAPSSWRRAWRRCASVSAAARSAIASACTRSSLPLRKARRVNSPGSARRSPSRPSAAISAASTARLPCRCNSATSSPVALCGAGNHSTSPSSMSSPLAGSRSRTCRARRGGGRPPASAASAGPACGPDMRTTAIAAVPAPWPGRRSCRVRVPADRARAAAPAARLQLFLVGLQHQPLDAAAVLQVRLQDLVDVLRCSRSGTRRPRDRSPCWGRARSGRGSRRHCSGCSRCRAALAFSRI